MGSGTSDGSHKVFGMPLHQLVVGDIKVPIVVDRLITTIEMYGLYTEGIYRKSGVRTCLSNFVVILTFMNCCFFHIC